MNTTRNIALCWMSLTGGLLAGPIASPITAIIITEVPCQTEYYLEATPSYGFAAQNQFKGQNGIGKIDMYGGDITAGIQLCPRSSLNLRMGYGYGSGSGHETIGGIVLDEHTHLNTLYLMPGYRYTWDMTQSLDFFAGINLGVANQSIKGRVIVASERLSSHKSEWGFQYSAEIGATYDFSECLYGIAALQFQGSTCNPKNKFDDVTIQSKKQEYYTVRFGLGMKF